MGDFGWPSGNSAALGIKCCFFEFDGIRTGNDIQRATKTKNKDSNVNRTILVLGEKAFSIIDEAAKANIITP